MPVISASISGRQTTGSRSRIQLFSGPAKSSDGRRARSRRYGSRTRWVFWTGPCRLPMDRAPRRCRALTAIRCHRDRTPPRRGVPTHQAVATAPRRSGRTKEAGRRDRGRRTTSPAPIDRGARTAWREEGSHQSRRDLATRRLQSDAQRCCAGSPAFRTIVQASI